jgi:hypothetical protein
MNFLKSAMFVKKVTFLVVLALLLAASATAEEEKYRRLDLLTNQPKGTEYLTYKLSYSGLITGFAWKDLADVAFYIQSGEMKFEGVRTCESIMRLTTENHSFAELLHPIRYEWISLTDPGLNRTYLVEEIDGGKSDNHHIVWLDWGDEKFHFYRKRKLNKIDKTPNWTFSGEKEYVYKWDDDGHEPIPEFLDRYPPVNEGTMGYLIHDKTESGLEAETAIDPLSMIYHLRRHDFESEPSVEMTLTLNKDIEEYRASLVGKEEIWVDKTKLNALVVEITHRNEEEAEEEGWLRVWFSDDDQRIPLNFQAEAPVGKFRVKVSEPSLKKAMDGKAPQACLKKAAL